MKKGREIGLTLVILVSVIGLGLIGCAQPAPAPAPAPTVTVTTTATPAPMEKFIFKYSDTDPIAASGPNYAYEPTFKKVEEMTGGRLTFERFYGGTLLASDTAYEGCRSGVVDMTTARQYTGGAFLVAQIGMMPYAAKDTYNVIRGLNQLVAKGYMDDILPGLKFLSVTATTPYQFLFKDKKPMTVEELKGIKMRSAGGYLGNGLSALGIVPVTIIPAEVYDSLSKGVIDSVYWSVSAMYDFKSYELAKNLLEFGAQVWTASIIVMNEKSYNSLPPDLQKIVNDELAEKLGLVRMEAFRTGDKPAMTAMKAAGVQTYSFSDTELEKARKAVLPVWDKGIEDLDKKGLPGKQVMTDFVNALKALGENPPWTP